MSTEPVHLTLIITPRAGGAQVRWEAQVLGVRHSRFVLPYPEAALRLVLRALDLLQSRRDPRTVFTAQEQAHLAALGLWDDAGRIVDTASQQIGRALYRALVADAQGAQALGTVREYAAAQNRPLALGLRLPDDAVELAALPWELLWDDGPVPLLLSRGRAAECTRYLDLPCALPAPRPYRLPLRILVLAPQAGISSQVRQAERRAREVVWKPLLDSGQVVMREISPVTRAALVDALQAEPLPDVIHYYGHGRYEQGVGALLLDSTVGKGCWTNVNALMPLFGGARMVALFACQGAAVGLAQNMLTGVAPALSAAGVPVVLAMQLTVRVQAATRASGVMYRALVAGWSVQRAVSLARQALYVEENDRASWYVPVLYVRAADAAPVHVMAPPAHSGSAAGAAPTSTETGTRQRITARRNSRVGQVEMHGSGAAQQSVAADLHSAIEQARMRAVGAGDQQIEAEEHSAVADVDLESAQG